MNQIDTSELQLENIQKGTEVTYVLPTDKGVKYSGVFVVREFSTLHNKWRYGRSGACRDMGLIPADGKGYYAMHSRATPHFYFSANPKHVAAAKEAQQKAQKLRDDQEKKDKRNLKELQSKLDALLSEYGATISPVQLAGDDQGVELGIRIRINSQCLEVGE
jgi:hypothetical protein